jgi:putative transposase
LIDEYYGRIERFFGTLKATLKILPAELKTVDEIPYLLQNFQWWYNNIRMHQNLSYQTPEQIYCQQARLYQQKE